MPLKDPELRKKYRDEYTKRTKDQKKAYDKMYNSINKEKKVKSAIVWNQNNPEKHKAHLDKWLNSNPAKRKSIILKNEYGITLDDYNKMFDSQDGCCGICGKHQKYLKRTLHVDHCHTHNKVRGLLCQNCNTLLGHAFDSEEVLKRALEYLAK